MAFHFVIKLFLPCLQGLPTASGWSELQTGENADNAVICLTINEFLEDEENGG